MALSPLTLPIGARRSGSSWSEVMEMVSTSCLSSFCSSLWLAV
jgi:hypothetical protein